MCPYHSNGVDPQTEEIYARVYGWTVEPCPLEHPPLPDRRASPTDQIGLVLLFALTLYLAGLVNRAINRQSVETLDR